MKIKIEKINKLENAAVLIIPVLEENLKKVAAKIKNLEAAIKEQDFNAKKDEVLVLNSFLGHKKLILAGLGALNSLKDDEVMNVGGKLYDIAGKEEEVTLDLTNVDTPELTKRMAFSLIAGFRLKGWDFKKYFTSKKAKAVKFTKEFNLIVENCEITDSVLYANALVEGVYLARDLVTEPANVLYSDTFAEAIENLSEIGLEIQILDQNELQKLGMGSLLSVNQASSHEAKVGILKWNGGSSNTEPLAFIGKGVTFDSGGLSLKPAAAMMEMKRDMAGAAAVVGLLKTLALRKAKVNAVGVVGLVENVVSSKATRPGDVVTSLSGKTIEILNTDAEGRLVLADLLTYTENTFKPRFMVNLATLTGAIIIALGRYRAGLFSNNDAFITELLASGEQSGEKLWNMPVGDEYRPYLDSEIADICNIANVPGAAGSVTAAVFLKEFVTSKKWAHIDIAGVAWVPSANSLGKKGATGFGIRLLDTLINKYYEEK